MLHMRALCLALVAAPAIVLARGDYPAAPAPEHPTAEHLPKIKLPCPNCPWNNPDFGPYPPPYNAPKGFKPVHRGKHFDVYTHWMTTHYSEVFWTAQPAVDLPAHIVKLFAGRAIAITGFETDVVTGGENGTLETSVPEFEVYNHHFCATIVGEQAKMTFVGERAQDALLHDKTRKRRHAIEVHAPEWEPRATPAADVNDTTPTAHNFWMGNGGEHRKSFKHLPKGVGQMIHSPKQFVLQPMLINTKYPAKPGQTPREAFHDGTLPKAALSPLGANYSGLMECPCTTRVKKVYTGYAARSSEQCASNNTVSTDEECFSAVRELLGDVLANHTVHEATSPPGCYVISSTKGNEAYCNTETDSTVNCGASASTKVRSTGSAESTKRDLRLSLDLDERTGNATITIRGPAGLWFGVGFNASAMVDLPYTIVVDGDGQVSEHSLANHMPGSVLPPSLEVISNSVLPQESLPVKMSHSGTVMRSHDVRDWEVCRSECDGDLRCHAWTFLPSRFATPYNLVGPSCRLMSDRGHGFESKGWMDGMLSGETIRNGPNATNVTLWRTVVLTRKLAGRNKNYYSFDPRLSALSFIEAVGTSSTFQYHGPSRGGSSIVMVEVGAPVCVCRTDVESGSINGIPWANNCADWPDTTIKRDHNPSCSLQTYGGGMMCCHHGIFLLDADQEVPEETFTFRMKWRFYYEEPKPIENTVNGHEADYQNAFFMFTEVEKYHGEYDVPKCAEGTPPSQCIHTIESHFQLKDAVHECVDRADVWCSPTQPNHSFPQSQFIKLVHISPHCHGPACMDMRLINSDTNETICYTSPHYGDADSSMNEAGYAAGIPPCQWGTAEEGLLPPPRLALTANLTAIKRVNSTNGHYGVMAHWQMRGIWG